MSYQGGVELWALVLKVTEVSVVGCAQTLYVVRRGEPAENALTRAVVLLVDKLSFQNSTIAASLL